MGKEYLIEYLPAARKDLLGTVSYIRNVLKAPIAAKNFMYKIGKAVERLGRFPYACRVYDVGQPLEYEVRLLPVGNYNVFYVVESGIVVIHCVIYGARDVTLLEI